MLTEDMFYEETTGDLGNAFLPPTPTVSSPPQEASRTERLAERRTSKLNKLSERVGYSPTDRTNEFVSVDGYRESLNNKVLNDYTSAELDYIGQRLNEEYGVIETSEGLFRQSQDGSLTPYEGDPNDLMSYYEYGTFDGNIKKGTWGGRDPSGRYSEEYLSTRERPEFIGENGVNVEDLRRHYLLPSNIVRTFEALQHGSSDNLRNRVVRQQENNLEQYYIDRDRIGSGATEVYRTPEEQIEAQIDKEKLWEGVNNRFQFGGPSDKTTDPTKDTFAAKVASGNFYSYRADTPLNRAQNTLRAIGASATRSLLFDSAAAVASLFGQELGTEDSRRELANEIFGYEDVYANTAIQRISDRVEKMYDAKEVDMSEVLSIMGDTFTNQEIIGDSLGVLFGTLFGLGKFTSTGKAVSAVEKNYRAGNITKSQAKEMVSGIKSTSSLIDKVSHFAASTAGYWATVAGMTNNKVQEFIENNEGEADVFDVLRIGAFQAAIAGVDRFAGQIALRDIPGIRSMGMFAPESTKALKGVIEEMPANLYLQTADSVIKVLSGTAKLSGGAAFEGLTEYAQTMAEVFSAQYASKKYGDVFTEIFQDRANQIEALTGAAIGVSMGAEMGVINSSAQLVQEGIQTGVASRAQPTASKSTQQENTANEEAEKEASAEREADLQTFKKVVGKFQQSLDDNEITQENIPEFLYLLEEVKRTQYASKEGRPDRLAIAEELISRTEARVVDLIKASPDGNIPLLSNTLETDKPILGSGPLTPEMAKVLAETAIDSVSASYTEQIPEQDIIKLNNFGIANGVSAERINQIIKNRAAVESEATIEERGILGRERQLDLMLASGTATKRQVQRAYNEAAGFLGTTLTSINQLESGIRKAQERADTENQKLSAGGKGKSFSVITDYEKLSTGKTPNYFDITVSFDGKTYTPDVRTALQNIQDKRRTAEGLTRLLAKFSQEASDYLDTNTALSMGGYVVPKSKSEYRETGYVQSVLDVLKDSPIKGKVINKIIVGNNPSNRWKEGSDRRASNILRINSQAQAGEGVQAYNSSDVVYLHAPHSFAPKGTKNSDFTLSELYTETLPDGRTNPVVTEVKAAMAAGATIVLDIENTTKSPAGIRLAKYLQENNYIPFGSPSGDSAVEANIYVPATEENLARLEAVRKDLERKRKEKESKSKREEKLIDIAIEQEARKIESYGKTNDEDFKNEVESVMEESLQDFEPLARKQLKNSEESVTEEAVKAKAYENMQKFMTTRAKRLAKEFRQEVKLKKQTLGAIKFTNKAFEAVVKRDEHLKKDVEEKAITSLKVWGDAYLTRKSKKELAEALKEVDPEIQLSSVGKEILEQSAGALNDIITYSVDYTRIDTEGKKSSFQKQSFNVSDIVIGKEFTEKGIKLIPNRINSITHNPTDWLKVSSPTPLNTLPLEALPEIFKDITSSFSSVVKELVPALTKEEVSMTNTTGKREDYANIIHTLDSPARTIIFDREGKIQDNIITAMALSVGDLLKTEFIKLSLGPKDNKTVANMFGVTETEVTQDMRKVAEENGVFAKTVANNLGKAVLKGLGYSRAKDTQVNKGQYDRLVADLGNLTLLAAENLGILGTKTVSSNALSELYRDGEERSSAATTMFVHIPSGKNRKKVDSFSEEYALVEEFIPDPLNNKKGPKFGELLSKPEKTEYLDSIRNDLVRGQIPAEAKKALNAFMDTPYEMNMDVVTDLLEAIKNEDTLLSIKKGLGYVEISEDNPEYVNMTYRNKIIQKAINRDIEKSIGTIIEYHEAISSGKDNKLYFPFFYAGNHRYMIDSNTLNGQADKFHRFLVVPKAHNVEYEVNRSNNTFTYKYEDNGETKTINSSLFVRAALSQAFGVEIDKTKTVDIVDHGNKFLSLTPADIRTIKDELFKTGTFTLYTDTEGPVTYKPDHITHALQAIDFLQKYSSSTGTTFTHSLSAEFDALTSGFSNKVQQFGLIQDRIEHLRRVGIIDSANETEVAELFKDDSFGVNDMLSNPDLLDSYKGMAETTIKDVDVRSRALEPKTRSLFDTISPLFPGGEQLGRSGEKISISSALRSMFKPGFMIFNYSAGINRIVTNLGEAMVEDIVNKIAKADLTKLTPEEKTSMEAVAGLVKGAKGKKTTLKQLQDRLRKERLDLLEVEKTVEHKGKRVEVTEPLSTYLIDTLIRPTYGESMKNTFETQFKEFIEIQNATNDAFKMSYAIFGKLLSQKVDEHRETTENSPITEEALLGMISDLRDAFPVIAGPLSTALEEGVHVYDTDTRTPEGSLATTIAPQLKYNKNGEVVSRKMNLLIKSIIAAANSGAVLPFHALDGAQIATTSNTLMEEFVSKMATPTTGAGVIPIHDAIMPPLPFADIAAWIYNQKTVELNRNYSIMAEVQKMTDRANDILEGKDPRFSVNPSLIKPVTTITAVDTKALSKKKKELGSLVKLATTESRTRKISTLREEIAELEQATKFSAAFEVVKSNVDRLAKQVEEARETLRLERTKTGALVGLPGSIYTQGEDSGPRTAYLENFDYSRLDGVKAATTELKEGSTIPSLKDLKKQTNTFGETLELFDEANAGRAAISKSVIYETVKGMRSHRAYQIASNGSLANTHIEVEVGDVVSVLASNLEGTTKRPLSEKETEAILESWGIAITSARDVLARGGILAFADNVSGDYEGDATTNGEKFIFNRLVESGEYNWTVATVDGSEVYLVSKQEPTTETTDTLLDEAPAANIDTLKKVTNEDHDKDVLSKFKQIKEKGGC